MKGGTGKGRPTDEIEKYSTRSVREIARRTGITKCKVYRTLNCICRNMLERKRQDPQYFLKNVEYLR